jgi:hypothetical protein
VVVVLWYQGEKASRKKIQLSREKKAKTSQTAADFPFADYQSMMKGGIQAKALQKASKSETKTKFPAESDEVLP